MAHDIAQRSHPTKLLVSCIVEDNQAIHGLFSHAVGSVLQIVIRETVQDFVRQYIADLSGCWIFSLGDGSNGNITISDDACHVE